MKRGALLAVLLAGAGSAAWTQEDALSAAFENGRDAAASGSSLAFGRCALGPMEECFDRLSAGLPPEDRPFVRLDGVEVRVDPQRLSASPNFRTLQNVAGRKGELTEIEVISPAQTYDILVQTRYPGPYVSVRTPMGSPKTDDGFEGYTLFPFHGKQEPGVVYTSGRAVLVLVNTDQSPGSVTETFHHELRHVLLGDFGHLATKAEHGLSRVDKETREAEEEARLNAVR